MEQMTDVIFIGCGAHRLNNTIQDALNQILLYKQVNIFCKENKGPGLSLTRWYGHFRQVEYCVKHLEKFNEVIAIPSNYVKFCALDTVVLQQMHKTLKLLTKLGKFSEEEAPLADHVFP